MGGTAKATDDGAAVDDPGVRGGGGGGGCRDAHAPGAPRRAEADRRAHLDAPPAIRRDTPLRGLPAPRCARARLSLSWFWPEVSALSLQRSDWLAFFFFWPPGCADIYWKNEHRLMCTSEICTADERIRFEKSVSELRSCAPFQF